MYTPKLHPGSQFPDIDVELLSGDSANLKQTQSENSWKLVVIYRGRHCPLCTKYLNQLETLKEDFKSINVEIIAVSSNTKEQLTDHMEELSISYPIAYGLTLEQMHQLGLYISQPRSEKESTQEFAEPGLFIINEHGQVKVAALSNMPFSRPDLTTLFNGLQWLRGLDTDYPIRGSLEY